MSSFEMNAAMVNYLLQPREGEDGKVLLPQKQPYTAIMPLLDTKALEKVSTLNKSVVKILQLLKRYYDEHGSMPSPIVYRHIKTSDVKFKRWIVDEATDDQRHDIKRLDGYLFQPVEDESFYQSSYLKLCTSVMMHQVSVQVMQKLTVEGNNVLDLFDNSYTQMMEFKKKLARITENDDHLEGFVYDPEKDASQYANISAVKTQYELIQLRPNGLFVLQGGPKDGKTRLIISVVRYLAKKGFDVVYFDLENGMVEMDARFLQADLTEWKGYPIPMEYIYSGTFIHKENIPLKEWSEEINNDMSKDDVVYKIETWNETEVNEEGAEREVVFVSVCLYKALIAKPYLDPTEDTEETDIGDQWEYLGEYEDEKDNVVESLESVLPRALKEVHKESHGNIDIIHQPYASIDQMEAHLERIIHDPRSDFFARPGKRVIVVDWMQLIDGANNIWERVEHSYREIKRWQSVYKSYAMVIDGVKDKDELKKLYPDFGKLGTLGTKKTGYHVDSMVAFCVSEEENSNRCARLAVNVARYGTSKKVAQEYLQVDEKYATIRPIDIQEHKDMNPKLWEDKPERKKRKTDDLFDNIKLT